MATIPDSYLDLGQAALRVKERAGIGDTDVTKDSLIQELLVLSAGNKANDEEGTLIYRPYYVAARQLEQDIKKQNLTAAENGVKFSGLVRTINSLMMMQGSIDTALGLIVPPGMEPVSVDEAIIGDVDKPKVAASYTSALPVNIVF